MTITMTVDGAAGRATRLDLSTRAATEPAIVDAWVVNLTEPVLVGGLDGAHLRAQFLVAVADLDNMAAGWPRTIGSTHRLIGGATARPFDPAWVDDWVVPDLLAGPFITIDFAAGGATDARRITRAVVTSAVGGAVPLTGPAAEAVWRGAVTAAAHLARRIVRVAP